MVKMLGRREVARKYAGCAIRRYTPSEGVGMAPEIFEQAVQASLPDVDKIITAYLAHMATLGWRMMPHEMTDDMNDASCAAIGQILKRSSVEQMHRAAYDHAPEPVEEG